jgi:FHA domain
MIKDTIISETMANKPWGIFIYDLGILCCFPSNSFFQLLLTKDRYTIGRHPSSDQLLDSNLVSSKHFSLSFISGSQTVAVLKDESLNGTFVNGISIKKSSTPLLDGAEIFVEPDHHFLFLYPDSKINWLLEKYYIFKHQELGSRFILINRGFFRRSPFGHQ